MLIARPKNKYSGLPFGLIISFVLIIGILTSIFVYFNTKKTLINSLESRVLTLTAALPNEYMYDLSADDKDLDKGTYQKIKEILVKAREVNNDVRFVYILGKSANSEIFFFVDSENPDSPDYSPPGQVYDEASDLLRSIFDNGLPATEGPVRDRWGNWISAMAPMIDRYDHKVLGVVGMDISADYYWQTLIIFTSLPLIIAFIISVLIFALYHSKKKDNELLALKSQFIAVASHEIRAPLSSIRWALESLLSASHTFTPDTRDTMTDMYERSTKMMYTLNNMADIISIESGVADKLSMVEFDLREALDEAVARTRFEATKSKVSVNFEHDNKPLTMNGDKDHIVRSFVEIIRNAIHYSAADDMVEIKVRELDHSYEVTVMDKYQDQYLEDMFDVFKGFKKSPNITNQVSDYGIGIGLYLAKSVVELHKGQIWFTHTDESGTMVHCRLPK